AEDVAPERIDAEPVLERWPRVERVVVEEVFGVERHDPRCGDRDGHQQRDERARHQCDLLPLELAPEFGPRRAYALVSQQRRRSRQAGNARVGHQRYRIVGLINPYSTSTIRLIRMNSSENSSTSAWMTG